eukprot:sb/3474881/
MCDMRPGETATTNFAVESPDTVFVLRNYILSRGYTTYQGQTHRSADSILFGAEEKLGLRKSTQDPVVRNPLCSSIVHKQSSSNNLQIELPATYTPRLQRERERERNWGNEPFELNSTVVAMPQPQKPLCFSS